MLHNHHHGVRGAPGRACHPAAAACPALGAYQPQIQGGAGLNQQLPAQPSRLASPRGAEPAQPATLGWGGTLAKEETTPAPAIRDGRAGGQDQPPPHRPRARAAHRGRVGWAAKPKQQGDRSDHTVSDCVTTPRNGRLGAGADQGTPPTQNPTKGIGTTCSTAADPSEYAVHILHNVTLTLHYM